MSIRRLSLFGLLVPAVLAGIVATAHVAWDGNLRAQDADAVHACMDGEDNDGDGSTDFPQDFSCSSQTDDDESNPEAQCQDGRDNDNDGERDNDDPGCEGTQDNDEFNEPEDEPECRDGRDNDNDGRVDFPQDPGCDSREDDDEFNEPEDEPECRDGRDNDNDGRVDFPQDPGCDSREDDDEFNEPQDEPECRDGRDNDNDGRVDYPQDPGCDSRDDDDEFNEPQHVPECRDGRDNDHDGRVDYPRDPGCDSRDDDDEGNDPHVPECRDGRDNDGDGRVDYPRDSGCSHPDDDDEGDDPTGGHQCSDGRDNDGDGATDFPEDFSCSSETDDDETNPKAQCQDGRDNDGDGRVDFPQDPGCESRQDNDEWNEPQHVPECRDGRDNDGDGKVDYPNDPGCDSREDDDESNDSHVPECRDGRDNDGDGKIDYPSDPGCDSRDDDDESNDPHVPECRDGRDNDGDGKIDYPSDPGCDSRDDDDERDNGRPNLEASKSGPSTILRGGIISYRITVRNTGNAYARDIRVVDHAPSGFEFVRGDSSPECSGSSNTVTCDQLQLEPGDAREVTVAFRVTESSQCGATVENDAEATLPDGTRARTNVVRTRVDCVAAERGCIEVRKETFDPDGRVVTPVAQFRFFLNGSDEERNDSAGIARFDDVPLGTHTISEDIPDGWEQTSVTPSGGRVVVDRFAPSCATVVFKNRQTDVGGTVLISKTDNRDRADRNEILTYQIRLENTSGTSRTVRVIDDLPSYVDFDSASDGGFRSGDDVRWDSVTIGARSSRTLTLRVRVRSNAPDGGEIRNIARIDGGPSDDDTTIIDHDNNDDDNDDDDTDRDLSVELRDSRDPVEPCEEFNYEVRVRNNRNVTARNVTVFLTLDSNTDTRSVSGNGNDRGRSVEWRNVTINRNATSTFSARVRVDCNARDGDRLDARASAGNDDDTEETRVEDDRYNNNDNDDYIPPYRDDDTDRVDRGLDVRKSADRSEAQPGDFVSYTIVIRNSTDRTLTDIDVRDTFNTSDLLVQQAGNGDVDGRTIRWTIDRLTRGQSVTLRYEGEISTSARHGTRIVNSVVANADSEYGEDQYTVSVIDRLPQTGVLGSLTGAGNAFLRPFRARTSSTDPSSPIIPITIVLVTGLAAGGVVGRKMLLGV